MATVVLTAWLVALMTIPVAGLQVSPGSPCAAYCLDSRQGDPFSPDSSSTSASEIVCQDSQFSSTSEGKKLKDCMTCLKDSEFVNGTESDLDWLLYNMKFATGTCLFGSPQNVDQELQLNSTCTTSSTCGPLQDAFESGSSDEDGSDGNNFDYCTASEDGFGKGLQPCVACLEDESDLVYMTNFINILSAACVYKPAAGALFVKGDIFSKDGFEINSQKTDSSSPEDSSKGSPKKEQGLSTAQIVGIVVGISSAFIIAAILFVVHFLRQKAIAQRELAQYHEYHRNFEKMVESGRSSTAQQPPAFDASNAHPTFPYSVDPPEQPETKMYTLRAPSPDLGSTSEHSAEVPAHPAYVPGIRSREDLRLHPRDLTPPAPAAAAASAASAAETTDAFQLPIFLDTPQRQQFGQMSPQSIANRNQQISPQGIPGRGQQFSPQSINGRGQQFSPQSIISRGQQFSPQSINGRGEQFSPQSVNTRADQFSPQSLRSLPMRGPTPAASPSFLSRQASPLGSIMSGVVMDRIPRRDQTATAPPEKMSRSMRKSSKRRRDAPTKLQISGPVHMTEPRFQDVPLNGAPQIARTPKYARFWQLLSPQQPPQSATSAIW